jgi:sarcosine oxidase subunit alpha
VINKELVIIGGGPAGLSAAQIAAEAGVDCLVIDREHRLGGQLIKQTHMFFGSEKQYAKTRGIDIAEILAEKIPSQVEFLTETTVLGLYPDRVLTVSNGDKYFKIKAEAILVATGASEKVLAFENNDLPGIYGAGAVQTLMNVYGVKPGQKIIMVGSGNIGLIVSYQLLQAGIEVLAVVEAAPQIGGYLVHASKLRRMGVPIRTSTTIKKAFGEETVTGVELIKLDDNWNEVSGSEEYLQVDGVCIAVGLTPLTNLLAMVGCKMQYISEFGGLVPVTNNYQTSIDKIYVAGDVAGIEEASSAMVEGSLAGLEAALALGKKHPNYDKLVNEYKRQLFVLRQGPSGQKTRAGLKKMEAIC